MTQADRLLSQSPGGSQGSPGVTCLLLAFLVGRVPEHSTGELLTFGFSEALAKLWKRHFYFQKYSGFPCCGGGWGVGWGGGRGEGRGEEAGWGCPSRFLDSPLFS